MRLVLLNLFFELLSSKQNLHYTCTVLLTNAQVELAGPMALECGPMAWSMGLWVWRVLLIRHDLWVCTGLANFILDEVSTYFASMEIVTPLLRTSSYSVRKLIVLGKKQSREMV